MQKERDCGTSLLYLLLAAMTFTTLRKKLFSLHCAKKLRLTEPSFNAILRSEQVKTSRVHQYTTAKLLLKSFKNGSASKMYIYTFFFFFKK